MECSISRKNIAVLCRICLTSTKNLTHLTSKNEKILNLKESWTIQKMLETVTFNKVVVDDEKFPSKICQMCLSLLKIAYEFQTQFVNSQKILKEIINDWPVEELTEAGKSVAPVELIYGNNKFNLKDVIVVEEEEDDECFSYEGFLNNLGTEISARFVNGHYEHKSKADRSNCEDRIVIEQLNTKPKPKLIMEKLKLEDFVDANTIIKTLYECKKCKRLFNSNSDLEVHINLCYNPPTQFVCDKCGHIAHSHSALYHHLQKHKGKRFSCDKCNKKYVTVSRLKVHMEVHKNERPYLCNVCGKNFNYAVALKYHMRLHTGEKRYVCNYCGLKYRMSNTLKRHMRTHTKDRPYMCRYCDKRFSSCGEVRCHEMLHTGDTPHQCVYCGKGYTKSFSLQCHYLSHSGPHECHVCPKTFIDMKFLRTHLKRVHKFEEFDEA